MATSEGIPSSIDIEFLELNDNPYIKSIGDTNPSLAMSMLDSLDINIRNQPERVINSSFGFRL